VVNEELLQEVIQNLEKAKVDDLAIVSVVGPLRTGKSFLLDLFIRYLSQLEQTPDLDARPNDESWMTNRNIEVNHDGLFLWRPSTERTTEGIWIYSRPFIRSVGGRRVGVVLMDTQGLFDHETDKQTNNTVFGLSTLLSSLQVLNLQNRIQENTLEELHLFTEFCHTAVAKYLSTSTSAKVS
jgi:atlastin